MPSHRRPKGSLVRTLPDWHFANMASGGIQFSPIVLGDSHAFGVFNDSAQGRWLVLWDIAVTFFPAGGIGAINLIDLGHLSGHDGQALTPGSALGGTIPSPGGQTWHEANFQDHTDDFFYLAMQNGQYHWPHDWPLAAVPSGWSIVAILDGNPASAGVVVNFVWEITANV